MRAHADDPVFAIRGHLPAMRAEKNSKKHHSGIPSVAAAGRPETPLVWIITICGRDISPPPRAEEALPTTGGSSHAAEAYIFP